MINYGPGVRRSYSTLCFLQLLQFTHIHRTHTDLVTTHLSSGRLRPAASSWPPGPAADADVYKLPLNAS